MLCLAPYFSATFLKDKHNNLFLLGFVGSGVVVVDPYARHPLKRTVGMRLSWANVSGSDLHVNISVAPICRNRAHKFFLDSDVRIFST